MAPNGSDRVGADQAVDAQADLETMRVNYATLRAALEDARDERDLWRQRSRDLQAKLDQAGVQVDQVIAQRDALQAKLVWAQGELSKTWSALAGRQEAR